MGTLSTSSSECSVQRTSKILAPAPGLSEGSSREWPKRQWLQGVPLITFCGDRWIILAPDGEFYF